MPIFHRKGPEVEYDAPPVAEEVATEILTRQLESLDDLISIDTLTKVLKASLDGVTSGEGDAQNIAFAVSRDIISKTLLSQAQQVSEEGINGAGLSGNATIPIMVAARLSSQVGIEVLVATVGGVGARASAQWQAECGAGLDKSSEEFFFSEIAREWENEKERRRKEEMSKEAEKDAAKWAEWDSLTEAERAARTFEMASAWKTPVSTSSESDQMTEEERQEKRAEKEAELMIEEKEVLENARVKAKEAVMDAFIKESIDRGRLIVIGTFKHWLDRKGGYEELANGAASLGAKVVAAYSSEGEPSQALNVLHGEVLGRLTRDAVDEVANWLATSTR